MAVDYAALKAGGFMRQKQKNTFSMRLKVVGGTVTTEQLQAIVAAANKYAHGYVHLTARQGIEIPFVKLENIEDIKRDLAEGGVPTSVCGPRVRTITACQGGKCCGWGCYDTYELAKKIDARYFGRELPHKFKFGLTGCVNNCLKCEENDVGIKGGEYVTWHEDACIYCGLCEETCREGAIKVSEKDHTVSIDRSKCNYCGRCVRCCPTEAWTGKGGYLLSFAGTFGNNIHMGKEVVPFIKDEDTLFRVCDCAIDYFAEHANKSERFALTLERIGWDDFKEKLMEIGRAHV